MIGVDAGDVDFIESCGASLPNLHRVLETGRRFPLDSTADVLTGSVWPTFYTGTLPGEHGVYHPIQWDPAAMRARRVDEEWLYCEPFWCELERQGETVVVFDVPFAFPSRLDRGIEVDNWGTHEYLGRFFSNRVEVGRELRRRFGAHPMGHDVPVPRSRAYTQRAARRLAEGAGRKGEITRWLMGKVAWTFFLAVFGESHRGGHLLWPDPGYEPFSAGRDALRDVYRAVDAAVGEVLAGVDEHETSVVVFALHGMERNRSQGHFVRSVMNRINAAFDGARAAQRESESRGGLVTALRAAVPAPLQHAIGRAAPIRLLDWVSDRDVTGGMDWSRTPGFALRPDLHGYLRFNLAGRESAGSLDSGSERHRGYEERLRREFEFLTAAHSGKRIVRDVLSMADIFPGRRSHLLPDLVVRWEDLPQATRIDSASFGSFSGAPDNGRCGEHRALGFAALLGPRRNDLLPPLTHGKEFPAFVSALL